MRRLRLHHLAGALGGQQRAVQVDREHPPPGLERKIQQRRNVKDAGIVDQDVKSIELARMRANNASWLSADVTSVTTASAWPPLKR